MLSRLRWTPLRFLKACKGIKSSQLVFASVLNGHAGGAMKGLFDTKVSTQSQVIQVGERFILA